MKFTVCLFLFYLSFLNSVHGDKIEHTYGDDRQGIVYGTEFARVKLPIEQNENATYEFTFPEVGFLLIFLNLILFFETN